MGCGTSVPKATDSPKGGITPPSVPRDRRLSKSVERLVEIGQQRAEEEEPEDTFEWSDFVVTTRQPSPLAPVKHTKAGDSASSASPNSTQGHLNVDDRRHITRLSLSNLRNPSSRRFSTRRSSMAGPVPPSGADMFEFGDFCVSLEAELEDKIVAEHMQEQAAKTPEVLQSVLENFAFPAMPPPQFSNITTVVSPSQKDNVTNLSSSINQRLVQPDNTVSRNLGGVIKDFTMYTLLGHSSRVKCVAIAPNEAYYVSCSHEDYNVSMHDIQTGREIVSYFGHENTIIGACFSHDSKLLATTSRDNTMILWDAVTGKQLFIFDHDKVVICCAFSHDSKHLVSGCQDMVCRVWDVRKRREVAQFAEHGGIIVCVAWSPEDSAIASAASDKTLKVWNAHTAGLLCTFLGHTGIVLSCCFALDGKYIVSNDEKTVKVWSVDTGRCVSTFDIHETHKTRSIKSNKRLAWTLATYCPTECAFYVIAVSNDRTVFILNPITGEEVLSFYCRAPVYSLAVGRSRKLVFGDSYGNIYVVVLGCGLGYLQ